MTLTSEEWLEALAARLGVAPPTHREVEDLLKVASIAAHSSERTAAPITCWLVARAGLNPVEALAVAEQCAESIIGESSKEAP